VGGLSLVSVCSLNTFNLSEHGCGPCGVTQRQSSMCTPDDLNALPYMRPLKPNSMDYKARVPLGAMPFERGRQLV